VPGICAGRIRASSSPRGDRNWRKVVDTPKGRRRRPDDAPGGVEMFSMVGRFRFRSFSDVEQQSLIQRIEQDAVPIIRESPGFRDVRFVVRPEENELMTVWLWDSAADWDAALAKLGPFIQQNFAPNLAQPPERLGGDVTTHVTPELAVQAGS
jgi:hypothetical protein